MGVPPKNLVKNKASPQRIPYFVYSTPQEILRFYSWIVHKYCWESVYKFVTHS